MKAIKLLAIAACVYVGIVVAFESFVSVVGKRQAENGVGPDENWLVITTTDAEGTKRNTVVAGVKVDGRLYVSANHWPRAWYNRMVENPDVEVVQRGEKRSYRAEPVTGEESAHVAREYELPLVIRVLAGFPPRSYLRLDPRREETR